MEAGDVVSNSLDLDPGAYVSLPNNTENVRYIVLKAVNNHLKAACVLSCEGIDTLIKHAHFKHIL